MALQAVIGPQAALHQAPQERRTDRVVLRGRLDEPNCVAWDQELQVDRPDIWLEVCKPKLDSPPPLPDRVSPWVSLDQVRNSHEIPEIRVEITVRKEVEVSPGEMEEREERIALADHPEVSEAWDVYLEKDWLAWAEADAPARRVQEIYHRLFSLYQKQNRLGDQ